MRTFIISVCTLLTAAFSATLCYAQDGTATQPILTTTDYVDVPYDWEFDSSFNFTRGKYGTRTNTNTVYIPLTLTRLFEEGEVGLTLPFIYQRSSTSVASVGGNPRRISRFAGGRSGQERGIGDILLNGRYYLLLEPYEQLNLTAFGQIKIPTADEAGGLGTGEFDETIGLEVSKSMDEIWTLYGDLYFTLMGDPNNREFKNVISLNLGLGYQFDEENQLTLFYQESTKLVDGTDNSREIVAGINHQMDEETTLYADLGIGIGDGSPDASFTAGVSYLFN